MVERNEKYRATVSFSKETWEKLTEQAKREHRTEGSIAAEATDKYYLNKEIEIAEQIARNSPEYKRILEKIKKDLGLDDTVIDKYLPNRSKSTGR